MASTKQASKAHPAKKQQHKQPKKGSLDRSRQFHARMTLKEILRHPESLDVLIHYQVPCLTCPLAQFELDKLTLEDIAQAYNIDLQGLLKELNKLDNLEN